MVAAKRVDEFIQIQKESEEIAAQLRSAIARLEDQPSPADQIRPDSGQTPTATWAW